MAECVASLSTELAAATGRASRDQPAAATSSLVPATSTLVPATVIPAVVPAAIGPAAVAAGGPGGDSITSSTVSTLTRAHAATTDGLQLVGRPRRTLALNLDGHLLEVVLRDDTAPQHVEELLRLLSGSCASDLLKLETPAGQLLAARSVVLSHQLADAGPYRLARVATHVCERSIEAKEEDLQLLKERLEKLEAELLRNSESIPPSVVDLRTNVSHLLRHLHRPDLIDWLGHRPPPVVHSRCQDIMKSRYRPLHESELNDVLRKFSLIREADVSEEVRQQLRTPTFDSWQWSQEEMLLLLQQMFVDLDLTTRFSVPLETLRRFLLRVFENYNVVPFHNFRHGFCVTQMMYSLVWACDLMVRIDPLDVFILLISCICHDLDHPGYNNIYQINAGTDLALRYNDVSPLENHHCSVAFTILQEPAANVLASLSAPEQRRAREGIIRCILATDMARHNEIIGQFREIVDEFDYSEPIHVNLLSMILIKIADISNEARPVPVADPWIDCLLQEFYNQSDREKAEGLPVTPFMDREKVNKAASQCNFISFVLMPLLTAACELLKELEGLMLHPAREALEHYSRLNEVPRSARPSLETGALTLGGLPTAANIEPLSEDTESSEDTLNEAEVSERSAKFKIATRNDSVCRRVSEDPPTSASLPSSGSGGDGTMRFSRYFRWMLSRPEEKRPSWAGPERTAGAVVGLMAADRRRPASSPHDARLLTNGRSSGTRGSPARTPKAGYLRSLVLKKREQSAGARDTSS